MIAAVRLGVGIVICQGNPDVNPGVGSAAHSPYHAALRKQKDSQ
jgi:hypothetical protein